MKIIAWLLSSKFLLNCLGTYLKRNDLNTLKWPTLGFKPVRATHGFLCNILFLINLLKICTTIETTSIQNLFCISREYIALFLNQIYPNISSKFIYESWNGNHLQCGLVWFSCLQKKLLSHSYKYKWQHNLVFIHLYTTR